MRTNILRSVAVALGLSLCVTAQADQGSELGGYQSPAKWSNFNSQPQRSSNFAFASTGQGEKKVAEAAEKAAKDHSATAELAAPKAADKAMPAPVRQHNQGGLEVSHDPYNPTPLHADQSAPMASAPCAPCAQPAPMYAPTQMSHHAAGACGTIATRPRLAPYYGGFNLLFLEVEDRYQRRLLNWDSDDRHRLDTSQVSPGTDTGFEVFAGRYLDGTNGQYGLSLGYFNFDPDEAERLQTPGTGLPDYYAPMPAWNNVDIIIGAAPADSTYNYFDSALGYRARRDIDVQGLELNLASFGLMGATRMAPVCGDPAGRLGNFGAALGLGGGCKGYSGAAGPLQRAAGGRVRVTTTHGLRWFQFEDSFELAGTIDGTAGYQAEDIYYNVDTENNLFGYQFGGRLTYCMGNRWNLGIGGKVGIYGNDVEVRERMGTQTTLAYISGAATETIDFEKSDTVLAGLAELDLGVGYRLNNAWSVRGGYRLLAATGVATSIGSITNDYADYQSASTYMNTNDSLILHGGYVGLEYNW